MARSIAQACTTYPHLLRPVVVTCHVPLCWVRLETRYDLVAAPAGDTVMATSPMWRSVALKVPVITAPMVMSEQGVWSIVKVRLGAELSSNNFTEFDGMMASVAGSSTSILIQRGPFNGAV